MTTYTTKDKRAGGKDRKAPALISPESLKREDDAPDFHDFWNKISNLTTDFYLKWGVFPNHLYMNALDYEDIGAAAIRDWATRTKMQVHTHKNIPRGMARCHREYIDTVEIARELSKWKPHELIESGKVADV